MNQLAASRLALARGPAPLPRRGSRLGLPAEPIRGEGLREAPDRSGSATVGCAIEELMTTDTRPEPALTRPAVASDAGELNG